MRMCCNWKSLLHQLLTHGSATFPVNSSPFFISNSQRVLLFSLLFFLPSKNPTLPTQRQSHFWFYCLESWSLQSLDFHSPRQHQAKPSKIFFALWASVLQSQHTREHLKGATLLAAAVPREAGCCFLHQITAAGLVLQKVAVPSQVQKGTVLQAGWQRHEVWRSPHRDETSTQCSGL